MVVTINMANLPQGVSRKEPPQDREVSILCLQDLPLMCDSGTHQSTRDANLELFKLMVECTECSNIRIMKLNKLRRQRRIDSSGLCEVSDSEEEESLPNISSYITQTKISVHTWANWNVSSGSKAVEIGTHPLDDGQPVEGRIDTEQLGNTDWKVFIGTQSQMPILKPLKSDYVDYSILGPAFRLDEASKNVHELDPSIILNALKQMAHFRVFVPLSMFTTQSLHRIHDNIRDLYTKRKTRLSARKYILNSDRFPGKDTLTEQTFF